LTALIEPLPPAADAAAERVQQWAAMGLPVPPSWRVRGDAVRDMTASDLSEALAAAAGGGDERYWLLHQGPATPGSQRESLLNLDSDRALAAALLQLFRRPDAPAQVIVQSLPARQAAGVLFTRHPVRQDLEHVVVEGVVERAGNEPARLILHRDGQIAFSSQDDPLGQCVGATPFADLAEHLRSRFERPQAGEWIYDGRQLWLVQTLPVGSLPRPEEAWSRRAGFGLWQQAVSPLWYTLAGRWLKTAFWRPLGERLGWQELGNIEPYRRQHSHIYSNSRFFLRLLDEGRPEMNEAMPPAWRPVMLPAARRRHWRRDGLRPWFTGRQLRSLASRLRRLTASEPALADLDGQWRRLMQLDRLGEALAAIEGWLAYCQAPDGREGEVAARLGRLLPPAQCEALIALGEGSPLPDEAGFGADPVLPRFGEQPPELARLRDVPTDRLARLSTLPRGAAGLSAQAAGLREQLGSALRRLLLGMGRVLVARGRLVRDEDIFFVYFDELWLLWQEQGARRPDLETLGSRKVRFLTDAYQGAPDWIIDQIAYGARLDQRERPVLNGRALVPGEASGPARLIHAGWALSQVQPGDVLVLDQCDTGWLPWLCLASGLVLCGHDPDQPAALLARLLGIPCIIGVDDAMHCLVSDSLLQLDSRTGVITQAGRTT
jgi:rifampicin phosphotransferase